MRALNKGWIGIALVVLFGASLFFFRGSSRYSNLFNSDNFVANVSGTHISTTQFLRSLEMNIGQFAQMIGEELTGDQIRSFQIHQLVLQNLVSNAIFENEFDNMNYILDDSIIAKKTKKRFPNLYNKNNQIDDEKLNSFLRQQRLKIEDLVNIIKYETRADVFDNLFFEKNYPFEFSKKINIYNDHSRIIKLLKIPFDQVTLPNFNQSKITKNSEELINYFEENRNNYLTQEKRDISYIIIDKNNFIENFIPTNNEISNYYNENKKIYTVPEKRSFKQFNFKTENEALSFKSNITGKSNDEINSYISSNDIKFNKFEDVDKNQVLDELSNSIFVLNVDDISDVIKTTLAYHLIILDKITIKRELSLNEASKEIKNTLTDVRLDNYFNELKLKINQEILDGFSMDELSTNNNLIVQTINKVQKSNDVDNLNNLIINSAFSQNKDFISDLYDFNDDKSFIVKVNEIYPSKVNNIDSVYDNLLNDFIRFKKLNFANELFNNVKEDKNFQMINNLFNIDAEEITVKLDSNDLPKSFIKNIFESDINETIFSSDFNNLYFANINKVQIPSNNEINNNINISSELKNAFGSEIIKTKNITFNDELINGLLSQYK